MVTRWLVILGTLVTSCLGCSSESSGSRRPELDAGSDHDAVAAGGATGMTDSSTGGTTHSGGTSSGGAADASDSSLATGGSPDSSSGGAGGFEASTSDGTDPEGSAPDAGDAAPDVHPCTAFPTIVDAFTVDNPNSELSFSVAIDTAEATRVRVRIQEAAGPVDFEVGDGDVLVKSHTVEVFGLHADTLHSLDVSATDGAGCVTHQTLEYTTGPLPEGLPETQATVSDPSRMSPGATLFPLAIWPGTDSINYLVIVDEAGRMIWYRKWPLGIHEAHRRANGNLVFGDGGEIVEMDLMGRVVKTWDRAPLGVDFIHHEVHETPSGRLLALTTELRSISGYPGGTGSTTYDVVGDDVFELDENGTFAGRWSLFDHLDPYLTNPSFDSNSNDVIYPNSPNGTTKDWTHANAIAVDPADDGLLVSSRSYNWIVKIARGASPHLVYRFGEGGDVTLTSGEWFYGQHGIDVLPDGHLLMYDNGLGRPNVPGDQLYSRAVEFSIEQAPESGAWSAAQVWEYRDSPDFFSPIWCDADLLSNGNVLVADGGRMTDPFAGLTAPTNLKWIHLVEVTHATPAEKVFELVIKKDLAPNFYGYSAYRAKRIAALHP